MISDRTSRTEINHSRRYFPTTSAAIGGGWMLSLSLLFGRSEEAAPDVFAQDGEVIHVPSGKHLAYGEVAAANAISTV